MALRKRIKVRYVDLNIKKSGFTSRFVATDNKSYNFSDIALLRSLFSNEKAKILYFLKHNNPKSIYSLAKSLKRDLKSIRQDLKLLERFGFVEFIQNKDGKRVSLIPKLSTDGMKIIISI